jgi:hypothetical protein
MTVTDSVITIEENPCTDLETDFESAVAECSSRPQLMPEYVTPTSSAVSTSRQTASSIAKRSVPYLDESGFKTGAINFKVRFSAGDIEEGTGERNVVRLRKPVVSPLLRRDTVAKPESLEVVHGVRFRARDATQTEKHFTALNLVTTAISERSVGYDKGLIKGYALASAEKDAFHEAVVLKMKEDEKERFRQFKENCLEVLQESSLVLAREEVRVESARAKEEKSLIRQLLTWIYGNVTSPINWFKTLICACVVFTNRRGFSLY